MLVIILNIKDLQLIQQSEHLEINAPSVLDIFQFTHQILDVLTNGISQRKDLLAWNTFIKITYQKANHY